MKKVLVVSYYFPPAGGSAVQRVLKFVKYLPQYGWHPVVLTAREANYSVIDRSLLKEIPQAVPVYRTAAPDLYKWYEKRVPARDDVSVDLLALAVDENLKREWLNRIALLVRSLFFIPDARIAWLPFALKKAKMIIRREKIKAIFSTAPPFTAALVAGLLSKMMGLPWISDYRDPWTQAYFYFQRHILSKWIENSLERWLLKQSGKVLSINEEILKGLGEKYGFWHKPKWEVIPNGYDPENFKFLKPIKDDFFSITYTGTLNAKMRPDSFLKAIQELVVEQPRFGEHLHLYFIGRIGSDVQSLFNDSLLKEKIRYIPFLPHEDCLRYTMGANLLLLLIPECSTQHLIVTGKLFEYLQSGNPILGLVPEGEAADIIRKTRTGFVVSPEDREKIKRVLWFCYRCWEGRKRVLTETVRWDRVQKYDRKKGTEKLARILDEIYQRPIL